MKERPVIFDSEMIRAILEGRKTQTRRLMAVQPESNQFGLLRISDSTKRSDIGKYHWAESNATGTHQRSALFSCPFGEVGDRLWVRETFSAVPDHEEPAGCSALLYAADDQGQHGKWTPSIHMPRWASRITLEITAVRVERLNDISEADARAEGVLPMPGAAEKLVGGKLAFAELWSSIYGYDGHKSWDANPWVWVIEFKRVEASND